MSGILGCTDNILTSGSGSGSGSGSASSPAAPVVPTPPPSAPPTTGTRQLHTREERSG
ncbi:hypothetical protein SISNIDRAFT_491791 [Sistotremastrum niveocremeum HHB9708]|uniref:Uncharacterized protein n=1 Tax=Sistotremastrum niveocremeum HHB9708 TaxID=1314777 RepID=A0A164MDT5_9AGAM|nr:hypothetical protein SISNIDRAFT_491791 [Sistotremastrum niveocremeum HHB9708]